MTYKQHRRSILKKLLSFPVVFLIPPTKAFHFQYLVSLPENRLENPYLVYQKALNQEKIRRISREFINKKQILKISEYQSHTKVKVNIVFNSKNSFNLWRALIEDSQIFNIKKLNDLKFKIDYLTKV